MDPDLIKILVCPETKLSLQVANDELLSKVNSAATKGELENLTGAKITEPIEALLLREDDKVAYPVRNGIPLLLAGEGILIE